MKQIESCFESKFGPGKIPIKFSNKTDFIALISPHAGYVYSGPCASHGFKALAETSLPETIILLGPNHTGYANSTFSLSLEDFETPLGVVKNNTEIGKKLLSNESINVQNDELAHKYEHSLEVQLPFLQYISSRAKRMNVNKAHNGSKNLTYNFKIVPIVISTQNYKELIDFSKIILDIVKKEKSIGIIASSDMTHYGSSYGFMPFPFDKKTKDNLYALDKSIIQKILKLSPEEFYKKASKSTVCGMAGITVLIEVSRVLKKKARLLKYYTSGDIVNDYSSAVGYGSIAFS